MCYENVFTDHCGIPAGDVIGRLMSHVFDDPLYLRFQLKPDCQTQSSGYPVMSDIPGSRQHPKTSRSSPTQGEGGGGGKRSPDSVNIPIKLDMVTPVDRTQVQIENNQPIVSDFYQVESVEHLSATDGTSIVKCSYIIVLLNVFFSFVLSTYLFTTPTR